MFSDSLGDELAGIVRKENAGSTLQNRVAQLFEEARDDVYRYLLTLGLYPPQAQETTQESFLRLYATLKKGEQIENPRAYVFRIAHNMGLRVRAQQHLAIPFEPDVEMQLVSPAENAEHILLEREKWVRFHRAVEGLSEQQRRCLSLRLEGLRYPEIGSILGISTSAVGEFLRRAMVRLRRIHED